MNYIDFDLNLIKIFIGVYETKSMFGASKKLYITQPAVTKSIKKLEEYLGGELFVRTPKGVMPTAEGEQFYLCVKDATNTILNGVNNFKDYSSLAVGKLNIGSSSTIIRRLLLPFIEKFSHKYPNIVISVTDATSDKLISLTKKSELDLAILNLPLEGSDGFNITSITTTSDGFIASSNFEKDFICKQDLNKYPLILQKRPSNNREYFETMCLDNDIVLEPNYEIGSFGLITDFTQKGMGIAFTILDFVKEDIEAGKVKEVKTDLNIKPRDVVAITLKSAVNSFACKTFIKELKEYFE